MRKSIKRLQQTLLNDENTKYDFVFTTKPSSSMREAKHRIEQPQQDLVDAENTKSMRSRKENLLTAERTLEETENLYGVLIKNIDDCKQLSPITLSSLGPVGTHKLFLNELVVQCPAAKLLVLAAKQQHKNFGDGTNLVVSIAGQHLEGAKELLISMGLDPTQIINGYKKASNKVGEILEALVQEGSETMDVRNKDQVILRMKAPVHSLLCMLEDILCPFIAEACIQVCPENPANFNVDNVRVAWLLGVSLYNSKTFRGMVLKVDTVVGSIKAIHDAKVLVVAGGVGVDTTESEQLEEAKFEEVIKASGAKVIVSGAGVGQKALQFCDDNKIMVLQIASKSELDCFCRTTEAKAVALSEFGSTVESEDPYLGYVNSILVEKTHGDRVNVTNKQGGVATVLLGACLDIRYHELLERAVVKGVYTYKALCRDNRIVPGAGATEFEIARQLRLFARKETGSDANAIEKYADSFELIPKTLAQNSYLDVEDIIENLKADHEAGNVEVGIDTDIWDLYTTKYQALEYAADAVCNALSVVDQGIFYNLMQAREFVLSKSKQFEETNIEMAESLNAIMQHNKDFRNDSWKWLGGVVHVGDKIFGVSPHGYLYSWDKVCKRILSWEIIDILPPPVLDNCSYILNSCIVMHSDGVEHEVKDIVVDEDEQVVKQIGNCKISKLVQELYVDPLTGNFCRTHKHGYDVCVTRSNIKLIWYEEGRQCKLGISIFDISILSDELFKRTEYSFGPGNHVVTWSAQKNGIIVEHKLPINVVCVKIAKDHASVCTLVKSLQDISHSSTNVLMVQDVKIVDKMCHFCVEQFGMPLKVKLASKVLPAPMNLLKILRGLVNGIRALHINDVAIGNLTCDDIFVDERWNLKIAPINRFSKFVTLKNGNSNLNLNLIHKDTKEIATSFFSSNDQEDNMREVGYIIYWCYTKRNYQGECKYHPPLKVKEYMKHIPPDVLDLLNYILHKGATAMDASSHYIFWPKEKAYEFIRAVSELLEVPKSKYRNTLEKAAQSVLGTKRVNNDVEVVEWTTKLPEQFLAIMKSEKHGHLVKDNGIQDTLYDYKGKLLYHLYQIIRNLLSHETSIRTRVSQTKNPSIDLIEMFNTKEGGLYRFLMKKFPNLINQPYHILKKEIQEDHRFVKFYKHSNPESE